MKHHRGASTCSTQLISDSTKDGYLPLHRSITDDHEDKHAKHSYDTTKSPITRFVCKLLGLEPTRTPTFGHKSGSTTSITKSSVFHHHHHRHRKTVKKKEIDHMMCHNSTSSNNSISSSTSSSSASASSSSSSCISSTISPMNPNLVIQSSCNQVDEKNVCQINMQHITPAMDALVMASQIPSAKRIQFVDEFDIPPPTLIHHHDPTTLPLLTDLLAEQLRPYLPRRYRLASEWKLLYSMNHHGTSLSTLYRSTMDSGPCIMVLKDDDHQVFGAFLNESIQPGLSYYGTGECFLWKISLPTNTDHHPIPKIKVFPWTGKNEYFFYSTIDCIAMGGGEGRFGLWLNQDLEKGHSEPCATFDNECLSLNPHFNCVHLEIWSFLI
ncbi:TLD-domain-containing protein [Halteromyces radiatus]|uniref:TLD-domain-containing protein n=1 Tax=Halteromyces radiatus TaxID=101107 RepID=UPI00221F9E57|nr:TLD-domain-containing protein [Halteromyces radiatus]KAI8085119.1 TLD-domain-containing protein [Halteromyces radiatus]